MVEPSKSKKKQEQFQDNFKSEHKVVLKIVFQLVRYVPTGASLGIFGSFVLNQDWLNAAITFPIVVMMVAWSAFGKGFLLQIQERMNIEGKKNAELKIQQAQKLDFFNFRIANSNTETIDLSGVDLSGIDLSGIDLSGANLRYANLKDADLRYANLRYANLSGTDLSGVEFRYANLSGADLKYANLSGADLKYANLSGANLNCTLLNGANLSDANLSGALLFFINLREVINLEQLQLKAKPSPFLCNVALPNYSQQPNVNPNRACAQIPQLLSDRYKISLQEAQWIVDEARQHQWN